MKLMVNLEDVVEREFRGRCVLGCRDLYEIGVGLCAKVTKRLMSEKFMSQKSARTLTNI